MMGIRDYYTNIKNSVVSIFEGMAVTFSWMLRRPHTIQYPDKLQKGRELVHGGFRGLLEVDTGLCTGCLACQRNCPIGVILVEVSKGTERFITRFDIDAAKCMYCGLCTEACPTNALRHTKEFAYSVDDIRKLILHYVKEPVKPYKPVKDSPQESSEIGRFISDIIKDRDAQYIQYTAPRISLHTDETSREKT
ncbi:MAG: 4Fe-4S binding protein [Deltaproteobacteria bacterium]|nr:4Fe-4S binding protein [Deltaproteobacteria bacterium]